MPIFLCGSYSKSAHLCRHGSPNYLICTELFRLTLFTSWLGHASLSHGLCAKLLLLPTKPSQPLIINIVILHISAQRLQLQESLPWSLLSKPLLPSRVDSDSLISLVGPCSSFFRWHISSQFVIMYFWGDVVNAFFPLWTLLHGSNFLFCSLFYPQFVSQCLAVYVYRMIQLFSNMKTTCCGKEECILLIVPSF